MLQNVWDKFRTHKEIGWLHLQTCDLKNSNPCFRGLVDKLIPSLTTQFTVRENIDIAQGPSVRLTDRVQESFVRLHTCHIYISTQRNKSGLNGTVCCHTFRQLITGRQSAIWLKTFPPSCSSVRCDARSTGKPLCSQTKRQFYPKQSGTSALKVQHSSQMNPLSVAPNVFSHAVRAIKSQQIRILLLWYSGMCLSWLRDRKLRLSLQMSGEKSFLQQSFVRVF